MLFKYKMSNSAFNKLELWSLNKIRVMELDMEHWNMEITPHLLI